MITEKEPHMKHFALVSSLFVVVLLISNIVATKLVQLGPFIVSGGIVVFPLSYIFGDVLTEVYGYARSRRVVWIGFLCMILASGVFLLVGILPAPIFWTNQAAYDAILGFVPRIVLASLIAYLVGEFCNSYILSKMKLWTKGKHLWTRTIGSTIVGEGIDTLLFTTIAFAGVISFDGLIIAGISGYFLKVAYEVLATPFTYKIVAYLKREEGCDHFDYDTNFNPFHLK